MTLAATLVFEDVIMREEAIQTRFEFTPDFSTERGTVLLAFEDFRFQRSGGFLIDLPPDLPILPTIDALEVSVAEAASGRVVFRGPAHAPGTIEGYDTEHFGVVWVADGLSLTANRRYLVVLTLPGYGAQRPLHPQFKLVVGVRARPWL